MIEPVFGHTKFSRRIDRFQRRGRAALREHLQTSQGRRGWRGKRFSSEEAAQAFDSLAARSEWRLITATHNPLKLHSHQIAAAGA
jgi:hypothetical protein